MLAARVGVLVVAAASTLAAQGCVNLSYPPGATGDGGGLATPHFQNGAACALDADCRSGFCTDGFCCGERCHDLCKTCGKSGSEGRCTLADEGSPSLDPHPPCTDQGTESCGTNGLCDGAGGCQKYPVGFVCKPPSCQTYNVNLASRCTADGQCVGETQSCMPYLCEDGATNCRTSCQHDQDCESPAQCQNGLCGGAKARGTGCSASDECASGFCEQGVCCTTACTGLCQSCAVPGSEGACTPVPAGKAPTPASSCATSDPSTCGFDGTCDGAGACRAYPAGTACGAASCSSATLHPASTCDGKMHCQTNPVVSCGGYTCANAVTCKTTCAADADCASPSVCGQQSSACGGLAAQYFRQTNLTDLAFTRTDPWINFNWGGGSPSPLLNVDNFSIRWRGKITARFDEPYTFSAATDDGERLWINGQLVIDHFVRHSTIPADTTKPIMMMAGVPVDIVFEYFENGGDASAVLSWSSKSEPAAIIPTSAFAPQ